MLLVSHYLPWSFVQAVPLCCLVLLIYQIWKWTDANMRHLRRCRRRVRRLMQRFNLVCPGSITVETQLHRKLVMLRHFRVTCIVYYLCFTVAYSLYTTLPQHRYYTTIIYEAVDFLVYIDIGLLFRLRDFGKFDNIELVQPKEDIVLLELPDCCHGYKDPHMLIGLPVSPEPAVAPVQTDKRPSHVP